MRDVNSEGQGVVFSQRRIESATQETRIEKLCRKVTFHGGTYTLMMGARWQRRFEYADVTDVARRAAFNITVGSRGARISKVFAGE